MLRLAWFSPLPPTRSGVATYSVEILSSLESRHAIDRYDEPRAHDFVWQHARHPYDLIVYQMGNASCHDYMWPYLVRHPGLVVLHDAQLHQARALALLSHAHRPNDYEAEFRYNHPDAPPEVVNFVIEGKGGSIFHFWPMLRLAIDAARTVVVHNDWLAGELRENFPAADIRPIRMGVAAIPADAGLRAAIREYHGIPNEAIVFSAFGYLTPEKRIPEILRAFRSLIHNQPPIYVLLVGAMPAHYNAAADAATLGIQDRVLQTGFVADTDVPAYLAAADACLCLRWPTSRESSAAWLRCLAAGKPTIITDLIHTVDVPALDPQNWTTLTTNLPGSDGEGAICVSIDITDENHSLKLAMRRLASDVVLRQQLGRRALAFWARAHSLEQMTEDYDRVLTHAAAQPVPPVDLPPHLRQDGSALTRRILGEVGVGVDFL